VLNGDDVEAPVPYVEESRSTHRHIEESGST